MLSGMTLTCPRCGEGAEDFPATEMTCRACQHRWLRPLPLAMAYLVRRVDGEEPSGPYTRSEVRQLLYTKALTGREKVRVPGHDGPWALLSEQAPFADILALLDIQTQRAGRIQGWQVKRDGPAEGVAVDSVPLPQPDEIDTDDDDEQGPSISRPALAAAVIILLAVVGGILAAVSG